MTYLTNHEKELYELRFSPMCKPAAEVANLTQLESHTTRSRLMMLWRVASGHLEWGEREIELLYESTLDSISEAFDVFHYPVSQYMLDARADVWEAGLAPLEVQEALTQATETCSNKPIPEIKGMTLILAGEICQLDSQEMYTNTLKQVLHTIDLDASIWVAASGALAYALGARDIARMQAQQIANVITDQAVDYLIADGPETAWVLKKVYPQLGVSLPEDKELHLLSSVLAEKGGLKSVQPGKIFYHDSRAAFLIAEGKPSHLSILPGHMLEGDFGSGEIYESPRRLLDKLGAERVTGTWTRAMAKSCGADDGLWKTHPHLAAGLARQRLDYAKLLSADLVVCDSPLCASYLESQLKPGDPAVNWLPELILSERRS